MKHKIQIQVVMLPTEVDEQLQSSIYKHSENDRISLGFLNSRSTKDIPQHLYITVSQDVEPIKEGDWFITIQNHIFKCVRVTATSVYFNQHNDGHEYIAQIERCRKVIATTDPKLTFRFTISGYRFHEFKKPIPQLPQSFIKEYVANPNRDWEVEYSEGTWELAGSLEDIMTKTLSDPSYPPIKPGTVGYSPKLNQGNTVTITLVEEKMYSLEQIRLAFQAGGRFGYCQRSIMANIGATCKEPNENDWIKKMKY